MFVLYWKSTAVARCTDNVDFHGSNFIIIMKPKKIYLHFWVSPKEANTKVWGRFYIFSIIILNACGNFIYFIMNIQNKQISRLAFISLWAWFSRANVLCVFQYNYKVFWTWLLLITSYWHKVFSARRQLWIYFDLSNSSSY